MSDLSAALLERGLVGEEQLRLAEQEDRTSNAGLAQVLIAHGLLTQEQLVPILAEQAGFWFVDLDSTEVDRGVVGLLPGVVCRRHTVLPIGTEGESVVLATADPGNVVALDEVRALLGRPVIPVVALRPVLEAAINRWIRADSEIADLGQSLEAEERDAEPADLSAIDAAVDEENPVVRYVNLLVSQAISDRASDIHIEPSERSLRVRYRVDGVLQERQTAAKNIQASLISRVKILSGIDIAEKRKPQDGRMSVNHKGRKIDLRVATLPTVWGEKVVMRVLDNSTASLDLRDLAFLEHNYDTYREAFTKPYGMILVTGPTGSGKSTTLYATLNSVAKPEINVITVEDPVEYRMPGINQVQVNPKAGLTFASALRSILRSDPDVVLLGEIRDHETAQIAIEAALTGHLVLSTLHTNDAPSAVTRLVEMGIEPFLVGSALDCVVAQRLARRLCDKCKQPVQAEPYMLQAVGVDWDGAGALPTVWRPVGCVACGKTGYRGRLALHEVMTVTEDIERHAVARSSSLQIRETASAQGMRSLRSDGWAKVLSGFTSTDELARVVA